VQKQWPEGPYADPEAARHRRRTGLRASRRAVREWFHVDFGTAHLGFAIVVIASVVVGVIWSPALSLIIGGAFAGLFVIALCGALLAGRRGRYALWGAYKATFGFAEFAFEMFSAWS
jgi:hypothetical protein